MMLTNSGKKGYWVGVGWFEDVDKHKKKLKLNRLLPLSGMREVRRWINLNWIEFYYFTKYVCCKNIFFVVFFELNDAPPATEQTFYIR